MIKKTLIFLLILCPLFAMSQDINKTDKNGLKQGVWMKTFPNGKIMYKGKFVDGYPVGRMERFHNNGNLKAILIFSEKGKKSQS